MASEMNGDDASVVRTLLVDNYDSYTYNLFQLLAEVNCVKPLVVQNDDFDSWAELLAHFPSEKHFDNVVISPGPGSPDVASDVGFVLDLLLNCDESIPILGVCLGHQAMAHVLGGRVTRADKPMHGRLSAITHDSTGLFQGLPTPLEVVRYHSLVVQEPLPDSLVVTARTDQGHVMALSHRSLPRWGVQFHPESIATQGGLGILSNFKRMTIAALGETEQAPTVGLDVNVTSDSNDIPGVSAKCELGVLVETIDFGGIGDNTFQLPNAQVLFDSLFSGPDAERLNGGMTFWLDSATCATTPKQQQRNDTTESYEKQKPTDTRARFSYLGDAGGPLAEYLEYFVDPSARQSTGQGALGGGCVGELVFHARQQSTVSADGWNAKHVGQVDLFEYLKDHRNKFAQDLRFEKFTRDVLTSDSQSSATETIEASALPFDFVCGHVGFFGYGLRNLCGVKASQTKGQPDDQADKHMLQRARADSISKRGSCDDGCEGGNEETVKQQVHDMDAHVPDAAFIFTDRVVVIDHLLHAIYVLALVGPSTNSNCSNDSARVRQLQGDWVDQTALKVKSLGQAAARVVSADVDSMNGTINTELGAQQKSTKKQRMLATSHELLADCSRENYLSNVTKCLNEITAGETYEVCLTNQLYLPSTPETSDAIEPWTLYRKLRKANPAPYAAFFRADPYGHLRKGASTSKVSVLQKQQRQSAFALCSSSPERFLRVTRNGVVESKPIKGTIRRGVDEKEDTELAEKLRTSVKDRAENLMIVDLVRNDLGKVCKVGSVQVPKLMGIESFATVHQLVSTVSGELEEGRCTLDAVRAAFPGGSMTGAPKLRTMQIIDTLEASERGVYSGSLGFLSLNGAADLNIVIRTAVVTPAGLSVGAGGAIVALSDPEEEYAEMLLKARALGFVGDAEPQCPSLSD